MLPPLDRPATRSKDIVIMGCGRTGLSIATALSEQGHTVHILDLNPNAFDLLPAGMIDDGRIMPIVGDGTLEGDLRRASTQDADVFIALSGRDARNALSAQIAKQILQVPTVICRMSDPNRKEMYTQLGLIAVSAASLVTETVLEATRS